MALNIEKIGRPVCRIVGGKYNNKLISVALKDDEIGEATHEFSQLVLNDGKFQQIPDTTKNREILYITAPSGAGKSTYTLKYLQ